MKKNTKGFTLIELLAVIVILAIIALIATPIVLGLIGKARKGAAEDSGYGLRKAAQLYYTTSLLDADTFTSITFTCNGTACTQDPAPASPAVAKTLDVDGTVPSAGSITIASNGTITATNVEINGFQCNIPSTGNVECDTSLSGWVTTSAS